MSLLIFVIVVLLVVAICVALPRSFSPDANVTNIGSLVLILIAVVVIAQRAGLF